MDKHPRCGIVFQFADKQQTADCRRNVDRPQSPVGALRSCGFVQVSNQHDSAPSSLCNVSQTAEDGTDSGKTESKTAQAQMLILELLADGKRMPSAELEKAVNERGISSRTMRTAKSRIGDRLVTEKDGTAWVCYLRN